MTRLLKALAGIELGIALALIVFGTARNVAAQTIKIRPVKDFKVPDYYPNATPGGTNQLKSLLTGTEARLNPDGRLIVKLPRIEQYSVSGQTQMVVKAAECLFDNKSNTAFSTNTLQFQSGDGRFHLEGVGFHWERTNSNLIISNQVRTLISRPLAESPSAKPAKTLGAEDQIEITSDGLKYLAEPKLATWRGNVRVHDPRLNMTCELVTAGFSRDEGTSESPSGKLESIVAETNVTITVTESNNVVLARSDKAVYSARTETLALTGGNPMIESPTHHLQIWSPDITVGLTNKTLKARPEVRTRIPTGAFGKIYERGPNLEPGAPPPAAGEENFDISSGEFEFDSASNLAVWRGKVRGKNPKLTLNSELLTAKLVAQGQTPESKDAKLENLMAETNVEMTITETNGVTTLRGDQAFYLAANETLVLSGNEALLESKSARLMLWSPSITMGLTNRFLHATAPVRTTLPSGALGNMGQAGFGPKPGIAGPGSLEENVEIRSNGPFAYDSESNVAIWRGNVRVNDPRLKQTSELLTVKFTDEGEKRTLTSIVAETNVVIVTVETNRTTTARGAKAVFTPANNELFLSGGETFVESEPSHLQLWAPAITVDLTSNTLRAKQPWRTQMPLGAFGKLGEEGFKAPQPASAKSK